MKEWFAALPLELAVVIMWGIGILRTSIVYALGYLAATGSARLERIRNAMQTPLYTRATAMINRWGAYAVPLCFLTVGLQTAVIITPGFTKMPMRRWLPGMLLGTLMWAIIYVTIGFALLAAFGFEPWMVPLIFVLLILISVTASKIRTYIADKRQS